ncbi:MAG: coproporphyrinogen dehydrogenase HemZ [Oscillospiraceae bacterium]|nr:coproporphyrinogen dehydrogenase HemZ [Oscillospiraceae bacterium]
MESPPAWGSLTGIRPAKMAERALEAGEGRAAAAKTLTREYYVSPERAEMCIDAAQSSIDLKSALDPRDIALYVGIPFCPTRCAYCSFISHDIGGAAKLMEPYTEALSREIRLAAETVARLGLRVVCVYIGGGTPTALPDALLARVLGELEARFDLSGLREYTVEAGRPDTFTPEKMRLLRSRGVDRVSINPQSMNERTLRAIGRRHTPGDTYAAFDMAAAAGFRTINMDIIAGLPAQSELPAQSKLREQSVVSSPETPEEFAYTVDELLKLSPHNLTVHTLSRKRGSRMAENGEPSAAPDAAPGVAEMIGYTLDVLPRGGYAPYYLYRQKRMAGAFENTGWTKTGHMGYYNLAVMEELQTILSVGAGGVTKLVCARSGLIQRRFNHKFPAEYIAASQKTEQNLRAAEKFYSDMEAT